MSIAELIMQGTQRSSESTAWVGDSLAKLGQSVGKALQEREQQKQAQEMLPFLQQSMQESMNLAQSGDTAGAYSNMMGIFASNPNLLQIKPLLPIVDLGLQGVKAATDSFLDSERLRVQENRYGARYGTAEEQPEQVDIERQLAVLNEEQLPEELPPVDEMVGLPIMEAQPTPAERAAQPSAEGQQPDMAGPTKEAASKLDEPPSEKNMETFIKKEDAFAKLPVDKQKIEMDTASIIFPDKEELDKYTPKKGRAVMPLSNSVRVGVPGAIAVELPEEYTKYVQGNVNINEKTQTVTYSLTKEKINPNAADAIKWLRDWQTASLQVAANPNLSKLLSQAGNDALNIDIVPSGGEGVAKRVLSGQANQQNQFDLSIKGNPTSKITVTKDEADKISMLQTQTAAANTYDAKFIRLKTTAQPKAATAKKLSPMDQQALDWANANSNDPRANQIKQRLGI
jgi:hypothetical protein